MNHHNSSILEHITYHIYHYVNGIVIVVEPKTYQKPRFFSFFWCVEPPAASVSALLSPGLAARRMRSALKALCHFGVSEGVLANDIPWYWLVYRDPYIGLL